MQRSLTLVTLVAATLVVAELVDGSYVEGTARPVIPKECPIPDPLDTTVHLAHEWDCTRFYKCDHGSRVLFKCPLMDKQGNRLHFNPVLQVCDWPQNAGCMNGAKPTGSGQIGEGTMRPTTTGLTLNPSTVTPTKKDLIQTTSSPVSINEVTVSTVESMTFEPNTEQTTKIHIDFTSPKLWTDEPTRPTRKPSTSVKPSTEIATEIPTKSTEKSTSLEPSTEKVTETTLEPMTEKTTQETITVPTEPNAQPSSNVPSTNDDTELTSTQASDELTTVEGTEATEGTTEVTTAKSDDDESSTSAEGSVTESLTTNMKTTSDYTSSPSTTLKPIGLDPSTESSSSIIDAETSTRTTTRYTTPVGTDEVDQTGIPTPSEFYVPHEYNCSLFYEVSKVGKKLFECPRGLHFSPTSLMCMGPLDAGCELTTVYTDTTTPSVPTCGKPCGSIGDGWLVPHECICDKFYRCSDGDLIVHQCSLGLHFNPTTYTCDYPSLAGCSQPTPEPTTVASTIMSTGYPSECPPENSGSTIQFPHPTNCSLFYKCDNGRKRLMQCPNGLYFNPTVQMCDWPDSAGCTATSNPVQSSESATESMSSTSDASSEHYTEYTTAIVTTSTVPTDCPVDDSGPPVQLPHPYNCSLYYICSNGEKVVQSCPPGLEFNPQEQMCDWPNENGCLANMTSTEPPEEPTRSSPSTTDSTTIRITTTKTTRPSTSTTNATTTTSTTTEKPTRPFTSTTDLTTIRTTTEKLTRPTTTDTVSSTIRSTTITVPTECPTDNSGKTIHLPYPSNCTLYYKCDNGMKIVQSCPPGLEFNAVEQVCDWPEKVGCVASTTEQSLTTVWTWTTTSMRPSESTTNLPSTAKNWTTSTRPTETSHVPSMTTASMKPPKTTVNPGSECPPEADGRQIPHETNCSLFYECEGGEKILMECTPGLQFSPTLELCVWPENAGCESQTPLPDVSSTTSDNNAEQSSSTIQHFSTTEGSGNLVPGGLGCIGTCPRKDPVNRTVLLPNEDCTKFCKCSNSNPYVFDCPVGLHFNPVTFVCDYPKQAKCQGRGGYGSTTVQSLNQDTQ